MSSKKRMIYMKTTKDDLELPVAVAESPTELGRMLGINPNVVSSSISKGIKCYHRIEIEEDEDEHNPDKRDAHRDQKNRCRA